MNNKEAFDDIIKGTKLAQPADCPDPVYKLMLSCWLMSPTARITVEEVVNTLQAISLNT